MKTRLTETPLAGLVVLDIEHFRDERGFFIESWHKRDFAAGRKSNWRSGRALRSGVRGSESHRHAGNRLYGRARL